LRGTRSSGPEQTLAAKPAASAPGTGATGFDRTMDFNPSEDDEATG
jgi:hypothetical protein